MIEYTLTVDDMRDLHRAGVARSRRSPWMLALLGGPLLALAGGLFLGSLVAPGWLCAAVLPAFCVAATWRNYLGLPPADADAEWGRQLNAINGFTVSASDEGIDVKSARSRTRYRWSAFNPDESFETSTLIVLRAEEALLVIPKRAFPAAADLEAFRALIVANVNMPGARTCR